MAYAYLTAGQTTFASTAWSDTIGFATNAQLAAYLTGQTISAGLDQSAVGTGINRIVFLDGSTGTVGTAAAPLKVDVDDSTGEWSTANPTRAYGAIFATAGEYHIEADGGSNVWSNLFIDTNAAVYLEGGEFTTVRLSRGPLAVDTNTKLVTVHMWGPASATVELKTSSLTTWYQYGGNTVMGRAASTAIWLYGGTMRYNCTSGTTAAVHILGGEFIHEGGDLTLVNATAGSYRAKLQRESTIATLNRELSCKFDGNDPLLVITTGVGFNPKIDL
jgi:hypothetical protein